MKLDVGFSTWVSDKDKTQMTNDADELTAKCKEVHDARTAVYKTLQIWGDDHVQAAISDGRITRADVLRLYIRLENKIVDCCMDTIPAPKE